MLHKVKLFTREYITGTAKVLVVRNWLRYCGFPGFQMNRCMIHFSVMNKG